MLRRLGSACYDSVGLRRARGDVSHQTRSDQAVDIAAVIGTRRCTELRLA
jgi:hypothetical protein